MEEWSATQRPVNDLLSSPPSSSSPSSSLFFPREVSPVALLEAACSSSSCWGWTHVPLPLAAAAAAGGGAAAAEGGDEKRRDDGRKGGRERRKAAVDVHGEGEGADTPPL